MVSGKWEGYRGEFNVYVDDKSLLTKNDSEQSFRLLISGYFKKTKLFNFVFRYVFVYIFNEYVRSFCSFSDHVIRNFISSHFLFTILGLGIFHPYGLYNVLYTISITLFYFFLFTASKSRQDSNKRLVSRCYNIEITVFPCPFRSRYT